VEDTGNRRVASVFWAMWRRMMKTLVIALAALLVVSRGYPARAQPVPSPCPPVYYGGAYPVPGCPGYPFSGYTPFACYPYPLPPAPSLGFGRGGIYGHVFVGRGESITGYTLPGRSAGR
jgi:hypothetical protein